ncbi:MAG: Dna2/Cas4 domain-containing protein [Anaerolineae bacterium]|nr:Dna2/Cas4 domain-containing protein [Anaerolineae bacterium]
MRPDPLIILAVIVILAGVAILVVTRRRRLELSLPRGEVVYEDTPEKPGQLLYSQRLKVMGKPDVLIQQGSMIIPVEVKTGKTPRQPYQTHIMQLITYCHLVEENYHVRPAYGIIRYPQQEFMIQYIEALEQELSRIVGEMRVKRGWDDIHRNHNQRAKCAACGFREVCSERLDVEYQAHLDL